MEGAIDAVVLNITKAADNNQKIRFDGVTEWQMNDGIHDDQIRLPAQTCNLRDVLIGMPTGTHVSGSMTNDRLRLDISGSIENATGGMEAFKVIGPIRGAFLMQP